MAEQEERRMRQKLNKEFNIFAGKVQEESGTVEADVPFRDLGFTGVPNRSNVLMQPTTECLVHLTEPPFTVYTLEDVELAYLERVQFGLKNFDLVFVFKDLNKPVAHINTIPAKALDGIKDWLDSVDIPFIEGPLNLNWPAILKNVNQDRAGFYEDGGWSTLAGDDDEGGSEDEEDSASEFEIESDEDDAETDSESDFSEADSDASEDGDEDADSDEDSEGEDWDELESKAKNQDRHKQKSRARDDSDDDLAPKKKQKSGGSKHR